MWNGKSHMTFLESMLFLKKIILLNKLLFKTIKYKKKLFQILQNFYKICLNSQHFSNEFFSNFKSLKVDLISLEETFSIIKRRKELNQEWNETPFLRNLFLCEAFNYLFNKVVEAKIKLFQQSVFFPALCWCVKTN